MRPYLAALIIAGHAVLASANVRAAQPQSSPLPATPASGFDLSRLKELDNPKLSPAQRAKLGEHFYREEMMHPTPHAKPPSTDPKSHDFVLSEITRKLVH